MATLSWYDAYELVRMPLFSVVIPTYNRLSLLKEALASVGAQTFTDCEVIVVDDGSTDGTAEWLRQQPRLRSFVQTNRGPGAARNRGAKEARGKYLAFLDSDDVWFPWTLKTFADAIERYHQPALLFGSSSEYFEGRGAGIENASNMSIDCKHFSDYLASSECALFVGSGNCAVNRAQFLSSEGFVEGLLNAEDIDLFLRLGACPGFVQILKPFTLAYRRHAGGLTANHHAAVAGVSFLVEGERSERYPGSPGRARERRQIITRSVRSVSFAAVRHVSVAAAVCLYWKTLDWHLLARRMKYLAGFWVFVVAELLAHRHVRATQGAPPKDRVYQPCQKPN